MNYESTTEVESRSHPGVRLRVRRMSFGRRLELTRQVKDLVGRMEFLRAGEGGPQDEAEAAVLGAEVDRAYLSWGLAAVEGLEIDGAEATPEALVDSGPEELVAEALEAVRAEAGLSEEERKNSESPSTLSTGAKPRGSATTVAA